MAANWPLYAMLLGNGAVRDARDVAIEQALTSIERGITEDPAYQKDALVNGVNIPMIVARTATGKCTIKAMPSTKIYVGDVLECLGERWIVTELYQDRLGIYNGEVWLCNHTIRFQNKTSVVHEHPCVVDDGTYSKRSSDPDAFVMTNTYKIYMSMNDETVRLYADKRISVGEIFDANGDTLLEVYKITGIDFVSRNAGAGSHLMVIVAQRDVYSPESDDITLCVCDVCREVEDDQSTPSAKGSCDIRGRDTVRIGMSRTFTATFADAEGNEIDGIDAVWELTLPDGVCGDINGAECSIFVPLEETIVGAQAVITLTDSSGEYGTCSKKVTVIPVV